MPAVLANLNPPATAWDFAALVKRIGSTLPPDFQDVYSVHNGEQGIALFAGTEYLASERIFDEWNVWNDLLEDGDLSYNGAGDHLCFDLDPARAGRRDQLIGMWHEAGDRTRIAGSLGEWLYQSANRLEAGEFE